MMLAPCFNEPTEGSIICPLHFWWKTASWKFVSAHMGFDTFTADPMVRAGSVRAVTMGFVFGLLTFHVISILFAGSN